MGLKLNATNGGGSVELNVPNTVNSDLAVTIPATAGEVAVKDVNDNLDITSINSLDFPTSGPLSNRNMVINGNMAIAQRGSSKTYDTSTPTLFASDRYRMSGSCTELSGTLERAYDAATGVPDLPFSLKWTTNTAESTVDAADILYIAQFIEGFNSQSPKFGTSAAQQTTLSFWVKCSIAGTYALSIYRGTTARNIVTTYTINSANTWEYKTITFPADTTGVVTPNTSEGVRLNWHLMAGSNYTGTDSSTWAAYSTTRWAGSGVINNSIPTTANATWEITGVQYEVGDMATSFEHRSYSDELQRCQRYYYEVCNPQLSSEGIGSGEFWSTDSSYVYVGFPTTMRALPTFSGFTAGNGPGYVITYGNNNVGYSNDSGSVLGLQGAGVNGAMIYTTQFVSTSSGVAGTVRTFPQGYASWMEKRSSDLRINFEAEL